MKNERYQGQADKRPRSVVYVERSSINVPSTEGSSAASTSKRDIFTVTRVVDTSSPLPGDILSKSDYDILVRDKRIKVIADREGKTRLANE